MKRILRLAVTGLLLAIIFWGCAKEFSYETDVNISGTSSTGSLKDTSGNCLPITVNGTYYNGVAILGDTTYLQITVNVQTTGSYNIQTDRQNGFQFAGVGVFNSTGNQTVNLKASGTPATKGAANFTVSYSGSSCSVTVNVNDTLSRGSGTGSAVYTLGGAPNACTNAAINGNYYSNTALSSTNTVVVPVNVTTAGTYSLTTTTVNGYKFSASGTFATTGSQNITLIASGTPVKAEADVFNPATGSSSCTFTVNVTNVSPSVYTLAGAPNACTSFVVNGSYYMGTALSSANTVVVNVNVTAVGSYTLLTNTVNGMAFSASGNFSAIGAQTVTLLGTGNPIDTGSSTLVLTAGGSANCSFIVPVVAATSPCTSLTPNDFTLSSTTGTVAYNVTGPAIPVIVTNYELQVNGTSPQDLIVDFPGMSQPASGVYVIGAGVTLKSVDPNYISNAIIWTADNGGKVYVTTDSITGSITLQFCNISFTGTSIISSSVYAGVGRAQIQTN